MLRAHEVDSYGGMRSLIRSPKLLIAVGALASIATQQASGWDDYQAHDLGSYALDRQLPSVRYTLHNELVGPGPFEGLDGLLQIDIYVTPAPTLPVKVEVRGITHPEDQSAIGMASIFDSHMPRTLNIPAWLACTTDPCAEDFEIIITLDPAETASVTVSGHISVSASGSADDVPAGTDVTSILTGPL